MLAGSFAAPATVSPPSLRRYMVAGALAGVSEHCVMFPMDTVKTRMQVAGSAETSVIGTARSVSPLPPARRRARPSSAREQAGELWL